MADRSLFTDDEWKALTEAPLRVTLALVAVGPHGPISVVKEVAASARVLAHPSEHGPADQLLAEIAKEAGSREARHDVEVHRGQSPQQVVDAAFTELAATAAALQSCPRTKRQRSGPGSSTSPTPSPERPRRLAPRSRSSSTASPPCSVPHPDSSTPAGCCGHRRLSLRSARLAVTLRDADAGAIELACYSLFVRRRRRKSTCGPRNGYSHSLRDLRLGDAPRVTVIGSASRGPFRSPLADLDLDLPSRQPSEPEPTRPCPPPSPSSASPPSCVERLARTASPSPPPSSKPPSSRRAGRAATSVGRAPTGSGKTIAFGIPLVAKVGKAAPPPPEGAGAGPDPGAGRPGPRRARDAGRPRSTPGRRLLRRRRLRRPDRPCGAAPTSRWPAPAGWPTSSTGRRPSWRTSSRSWSTKPTAWPTWGSCPRCGACSTRCARSARPRCSRPRWTAPWAR